MKRRRQPRAYANRDQDGRVTEHKRDENARALNAQRVSALLRLNQMTGATRKEITDFVLEQAVAWTQSKIGYLAFLNEDESVRTMHSWPRAAMEACAISDKPLRHPVETTGLWGDAVRQRRPVIANECAADNPLKKGDSQGHAQVKRHMNVPVYDKERIVIVAGVGNKTEEYDQGDVQQLTLLLEGMWQLLERNRAEHQIRERVKELRAFYTLSALLEREGITLEELYAEFTKALPASWQYPEITCARIVIGDSAFRTENFAASRWMQAAPIKAQGVVAGQIEVGYLEARPDEDEGPFLKEERQLIDALAARLGHIIERKRAEQALRMETGRLERASYAAKVALWDWDLGTGVLEWSKVVDAMLGFAPGGFPRELQAWEHIIHPDDQAQVKELLQRHLERGTPYEISYRVRRNDGVYVWWHDVGEAVRNERGEAVRMAGACVDITERKHLEEQRRELDARLHQTQRLESLGVLAGGIAHDFNNILMAILGHAELALDEVAPLTSGRESLQQIKTAALRAAELCTQMLAYAGKGCREKRDFCLDSLVDEMLHMLRTCLSKKCMLNLNLDRQQLFMHGDAIQIRQVLMNLVINASEAIGDRHGNITVSTGAMDCTQAYLDQNYLAPSLPPGRYVYLEVSDTGCGMSRETIQRMFEPFFTTKFTGRGLGLSAVLGIVQAHGGSLRVYSELGTGTTIKVLFPATAGPGSGGPASSAESHWRGRGTVLLVDDEEGVRTITGKMLERLGLDVLTASDGREGVAVYRDRQADIAVVLLDLTMPLMNGEEAFRALRQINPDVRVILASGYSESDVAARFAGQGLAGCVQKPYVLAKLRSLLSALLPAADAPQVADRKGET